MVDGLTGTKNGPIFASITNAVAVAPPGATIQVNAMTFNGALYGYNEEKHPQNNNPNVTGEMFSVTIPDGVTNQGVSNGNGPVYIYSTTGTPQAGQPKSLFKVDNSSATGDTSAILKNLRVVGMGQLADPNLSVPKVEAPT